MKNIIKLDLNNIYRNNEIKLEINITKIDPCGSVTGEGVFSLPSSGTGLGGSTADASLMPGGLPAGQGQVSHEGPVI